MVELRATSIEYANPAEVVCRDPASGASTMHHTLKVDRGLPFDSVLLLLDKAKGVPEELPSSVPVRCCPCM